MRISVIFFIGFLVIPSIVSAVPKALKPRCDFILVLDGSGSVNTKQQPDNYKKMLDMVRKWPDHFLITWDESRVGVIIFNVAATIIQDLTDEEEKVRQVDIEKKRWQGGTNTHKGLEAVNKMMKEKPREDALKIVIIITDGKSDNVPEAKALADQLRGKEVITYVLFIGDAYKTDPSIKNHVDNDLAGDEKRVFHVDDFSKLTDGLMGDIAMSIECDYVEVCRFIDETKCENVWVRLNTDQNCTNPPPDPVKRPFKKECADSAECEKSSSQASPITKTEDPRAKGDSTDKSKDDGGLAWWIIVIIVVVVLVLLIVAIVVIVVLVTRKKKRAKAAAEKSAAMKKPQQEKSGKEKTEKGKASMMSKSKVGGSKMEPASFGLGYNRGKGADDEMGVSLRDEKQETKGAKGGAAPKKSTGPQSQPKKSMAKSMGKSPAVAKKK